MAPQFRLYTPEIAETILERIADGEGLNFIVQSHGMPSRGAVQHWIINDHEGFAGRYARAREAALAIMADDVIGISDDGRNDTYVDSDGNRRVDNDVVQRSVLRVNSRKWVLSKLVPKIYGDKLELAGDLTLREVPDDAVESRLAVLLRTAGIVGFAGGEGAADGAAADQQLLPGPRPAET